MKLYAVEKFEFMDIDPNDPRLHMHRNDGDVMFLAADSKEEMLEMEAQMNHWFDCTTNPQSLDMVANPYHTDAFLHQQLKKYTNLFNQVQA